MRDRTTKPGGRKREEPASACYSGFFSSYNGGLFDEREAPLLSHVALPDRTLAGLIDAPSREASSRRWCPTHP
jgi:hypothetical protein